MQDWSKLCVVLEHMFVFVFVYVCLRAKLKTLIQPPWTDSQASMSHSYWITDIQSGNPLLEMSVIALNAVH